MDELIVYVPCKIHKIGTSCRIVPVRQAGIVRIDNEYKTVDSVNPDLVYNARQCLPRSIYKENFATFYDLCIRLGHTDEETRNFFNKFLLFSPFYEMPEPPPLLTFADLEEIVIADEQTMDNEFKKMLSASSTLQ